MWHEFSFHRGGPHFGHRRGGGFFGEMFGGPPPRADRGVVRFLVLDAIAEQARHGYEIMAAIEERSGGSYRPSPGVIYPTLQMLEELEHARAVEREGRKVYAITAEGKRDLAAHREEVDEFYERADAPEDHAEAFADFAKRFTRLLRAFKRASHRGMVTGSTMRKVTQVLDEAFTKIERILEGER